ncbi:MAG: hypothetical protein ACM3VS_18405 [Candidatus Dadabacteria bacterium]
MKYSLLLLLCLPFFSRAQDCKLTKSTDPFTHETKLSTGFAPFNYGVAKVSVSADATPSTIDLFFWVRNEGACFDNTSTALIIFEGEKSKNIYKNGGSMNCEGAFHISFKNSASTNFQLQKIATKKISSIKLTGTNKTEINLTLTEDQKTLLMNMAACAVNQGKTLIPQ